MTYDNVIQYWLYNYKNCDYTADPCTILYGYQLLSYELWLVGVCIYYITIHIYYV